MIFINIRRALVKERRAGGGEKEYFWRRRDTAVSSNRMCSGNDWGERWVLGNWKEGT